VLRWSATFVRTLPEDWQFRLVGDGQYTRDSLVSGEQFGIAARTRCAASSFGCAQIVLAGIETMHMVRKGQFDRPDVQPMSASDQFYSLAF
jgi:hypothetical protein